MIHSFQRKVLRKACLNKKLGKSHHVFRLTSTDFQCKTNWVIISHVTTISGHPIECSIFLVCNHSTHSHLNNLPVEFLLVGDLQSSSRGLWKIAKSLKLITSPLAKRGVGVRFHLLSIIPNLALRLPCYRHQKILQLENSHNNFKFARNHNFRSILNQKKTMIQTRLVLAVTILLSILISMTVASSVPVNSRSLGLSARHIKGVASPRVLEQEESTSNVAAKSTKRMSKKSKKMSNKGKNKMKASKKGNKASKKG